MLEPAALFHVDAFSDRPFAGNPAAVCLLERWLPDAILQAIAAENNLSETAFVGPADDRADFRLRWMTPAVEVDLCGHATLAAAHVLFSHRGFARPSVAFATRSGPVTVEQLERGRYRLDFPARPAETPGPPEVGLALGGSPPLVLDGIRDHLAIYPDQAAVAGLRPDFVRLAALPKSGIIATAPADPGQGLDFVSRFFAPRDGIDEDPVTGSAHCTLAPYWAARLGKPRLDAAQISARGGRLTCTISGDRVLIAGSAVTFSEGRIVPPA